ncbi:TPA: translation initiation factor [Candidatus Woesearchaeota archaeon]|nr:translation initiation factor [Candidatus Woesearchaeota archaeon]HIH31488.1 translation initiation factor [Candidatus Woesearchaeota archaeon]HIH54165.1 translation initiation factor [Candidatus Woesearchaeota archaeon]HIJ01109.1 translation initiation factor [Candidatus Woesearchaeota archaeon]HIJ13877.1 translation initiation factor [Candidatus Woesearchaeota archaeon]
MTDICNVCGLPKELCVCEQIARESQTITVKIVKKKFGKQYTVIEGIDTNEIDIKDVAKKLKNRLACGGTAKDGYIELQGNHLNKVQQGLIDLGFAPDTIQLR